jgi:hypothetical protein
MGDTIVRVPITLVIEVPEGADPDDVNEIAVAAIDAATQHVAAVREGEVAPIADWP